MLKKFLLPVCCILLFKSSYSQNVGINNTGASPHSSAMLDVQSNSRGLLMPRLSSIQRQGIAAPATGLMIYQADNDHGLHIYNGNNWFNFTPLVSRNRILHNLHFITSAYSDTAFVFGGNALNALSGLHTFSFSSTKAAFRAGRAEGVNSDYDSLGTYSAGFGRGGRASGNGSFTAGLDNISRGSYSVTFGLVTRATGIGAFAIGIDTRAEGPHSFAGGSSSTARGEYAIAFGAGNFTNANGAVAFGFANETRGLNGFTTGAGNTNYGASSVATGFDNEISGNNSFASGYHNTIRNENSASFGNDNIAQSPNEFIVGRFNDTIPGPSPATWASEQPLIIAGAGINHSARSNVWVLYKDGSQRISPTYQYPSSTTDRLYNYNGRLYYDGHQLGFNVFYNFNGVVHNSNWISGEDTLFVLGGSTLNNTVLVNDNARLVFHKPTYSFRAGFGNTEDWDYGNIGQGSVGFGYNTRAKGDHSLAGGFLSYADGNNSFSFGDNNRAIGPNSTAMGANAIAYGLRSVSMGQNTTAVSVGEFVIGRYNDTLASTNPSRTSWFSSNALFVAGNGPNAGNRSNAMVLYKNGTMHLQGAIKAGNVGTELDNVQARTVTLGSCSNTSGLCTFNVSFETEYFTAPSVIIATPLTQAGISPPDAFSATVKDITTTGFTVIIKRTDIAGSWGQQLRLSYIAMQ
ncbi:MAG TPA: H-type lectin domain-containing protein [Chitinophagaceae bacterium]|jgi:hypothetical protein|nr:H-type lectin domain-containing protein [Chitinophagaceae bacterium]